MSILKRKFTYRIPSILTSRAESDRVNGLPQILLVCLLFFELRLFGKVLTVRPHVFELAASHLDLAGHELG